MYSYYHCKVNAVPVLSCVETVGLALAGRSGFKLELKTWGGAMFAPF